MFKNYFITALRNLKREKVYAILNIAGLALGIGCALVIYKILTYELSYNKEQQHFEDIYRIVREKQISTGLIYNEGVPHPLRFGLKSDFPDLKFALTHYMYGGLIAIENGNGNINRFQEEDGVVFAQQGIFDVLDFKFLAGDKKSALIEPNSAVITESLAKKFYGVNSANVHQVLGNRFNLENSLEGFITGIIKDPPSTTDNPFKLLIHYESQGAINRYYGDGNRWNSNSSQTNCYIRLEEGQSPDELQDQLIGFIDKYHGEETSINERYVLQPLSDLHYNTNYNTYSESQTEKETLYALAIIGVFLVITAAINFINLATAQAVKRSKEVGIRKALGSKKIQLVIQFLSETTIITIIAAFVGFVISELLFIYLEDIIGHKLTLDLFGDTNSLVFVIALIVIVGALSGFYPSVIMSRMDPVIALKNKFNTNIGSGFMSFRRILVIVQFAISQILIIGTIVVGSQLDYFLAKDLGFNTEAIVTLNLPENEPAKLERLRSDLEANSNIELVSFNLSAPLGNSNSHANIHHQSLKEDVEYRVNFKIVDEAYFEVFGLELLAGRIFNKQDSSNRILVTRTLASLMGFDNPNDALGEKIRGWRGQSVIIGVVEDFHTQSLREEIDYVVLINNPSLFYEMDVKINTTGERLSEIQNTISIIEEAWTGMFPNYIFDYQFYDQQIADRYEDEQYIAKLFQLFALIAIFIGCLGLYGLIAYVANQKTKEIGIRKVLGASTFSILHIFSKEMVVLIIVAFIVAAPIGYYAMNLWLQDFAYRIPLSPMYFVYSILICLMIALFTVAYKSIRASLANPVISLKDE